MTSFLTCWRQNSRRDKFDFSSHSLNPGSAQRRPGIQAYFLAISCLFGPAVVGKQGRTFAIGRCILLIS